MINDIKVSKSRLFGDVNIEFDKGLNVITGPSGSGKSVLFSMLLGSFGFAEIKNLEALNMNLNINDEVLEKMADSGIYCEDKNINLSLLNAPKLRYFVENQAIAKKRLKEIFIDKVFCITQTSIKEIKNEYLLEMLDLQISNKKPDAKALASLKLEYKDCFLSLHGLRTDLEKLQKDKLEVENKREFLEFEIEKYKKIDPKEGEIEELLEFKRQLSKREKVNEAIKNARVVLENENNLINLYNLLSKPTDKITDLFLEISADIDEYLNKFDENIDVENILNRIEELSSLARRYGDINSARVAYLDNVEKLKECENIDVNFAKINNEIREKSTLLDSLSTQITRLRQKYLPAMQIEINKICDELMLGNVKMELRSINHNESGQDFVEITLNHTLISNISSGEFNRLNLALMVVKSINIDNFVLDSDKKILFFDEIDANLSGKESEGVAKILRILSNDYQIFAISHQSHLPAFASRHFLVSPDDASSSNIKSLNKDEQVLEIARMISGENITKEALEFAKTRLKMALE